ncbi:hypothetical protein SASPL_104755 [Salvia splendens]|uniref:Glycosyltransferase 2-like domain-containing protein n=1 Tax=Salvia splendens TaxID=180675 RepID=A0A8X8YM94_SALSN|nr:hypothetical protein SASPL_104755 [Salvia splendens]
MSDCITLVRTERRRIASAPAANRTESKLYKVIKLFLVLTVFLLSFELVAYFKGWHFSPPSLESEIEYSVEYVYAKWLKIRAYYLAPMLQNLTNACIVVFMIQSVDRFVLVLGCFYIKIRGLRPVAETDYSVGDEKEGTGLESYPMVMVQIPMCNEREVRSLVNACLLSLIRELRYTNNLLEQYVSRIGQKWQQRGVHIIYRHRLIRTGYKAGNLRSAMSCDYVKNYEFVAIFDADFQPGPDFLKKTIPYFKGKDDLALVQTRWGFVNKDENLLTRLQHINLAFHFEVEQQCLCELPESYEAYKKQQYRKELALAVILLAASVRSLMSAQGIHFYFLLFQGIAFLVVGLDLIGEQVS